MLRRTLPALLLLSIIFAGLAMRDAENAPEYRAPVPEP